MYVKTFFMMVIVYNLHACEGQRQEKCGKTSITDLEVKLIVRKTSYHPVKENWLRGVKFLH